MTGPGTTELDSITGARTAMRAGQVSSVELTTATLRRADELAHLGTFLSRFDEQALAAAAAADRERAAGLDRGPLHGVPLAVKDVISTADGPTTAQSLVLQAEWGSTVGDATAVRRLRDAGAIIVGKTTTMEFAFGMFDTDKPFPIPLNPWAADRFPGGSSSGNAVGLASGTFLGAVGTDTGGSIRCPSAFCGTTGLKPTYGMVSRHGTVPCAFSLDHVGPMARSALDCGVLLRVIAGFDAKDPSSARFGWERSEMPSGASLEGLRIGVERENHRNVGPATEACLEEALGVFVGLGARMVDVEVPHYQELDIASEVIKRSEVLAFHRESLMTRWADFGRSMRQLVLDGWLYSGADYVQAQRLRAVGAARVRAVFDEVDLIATPTARRAAPLLDQLSREGVRDSMLTGVWNLLGNPALAVPMGFDREGMPLSLQLIGRPFEDELVLAVGGAYQDHTQWHHRRPPIDTAPTYMLNVGQFDRSLHRGADWSTAERGSVDC